MTINTPILDKGYLELVEYMGSDEAIVRSARVSYNSDVVPENVKRSSTGLINYLIKNNHNTPLESSVMTFHVKLPIFVARQWMRHRTQSYNELSARYTQLESDYYVPEVEQITTQSTKNRQCKTDIENPLANESRTLIINNSEECFKNYQKLLDNKVPRELARLVIPVNTYTRMYTTINLHNCFRFLKERLHPHAQYEIRVYAERVLEHVDELYPIATKAFKEHVLN